MTDQQISTLINVLRFTNQITPLQKDILDTWDELQKKPLDTDSAHKQITYNNFSHPDIFMAISSMPGVVQKTAADLTQDDMIFTLRHQLDGLAAKEMEAHVNGYFG